MEKDYHYREFLMEYRVQDFMGIVVMDEEKNEEIGRNIFLDDQLVHIQTGYFDKGDHYEANLTLTLYDPIMTNIKYFSIHENEAVNLLYPQHLSADLANPLIKISFKDVFLDIYNDDVHISDDGYVILTFRLREELLIDDPRHKNHINKKFY